MRFLFFVVFVFAAASSMGGTGEEEFVRGDANSDGWINISDAQYITNYLYSGGPSPLCLDAADVNDDGMIDGSDPLAIVNWLFNGGPAPAPPNTCGVDSTSDALDCEDSPCQ